MSLFECLLLLTSKATSPPCQSHTLEQAVRQMHTHPEAILPTGSQYGCTQTAHSCDISPPRATLFFSQTLGLPSLWLLSYPIWISYFLSNIPQVLASPSSPGFSLSLLSPAAALYQRIHQQHPGHTWSGPHSSQATMPCLLPTLLAGLPAF